MLSQIESFDLHLNYNDENGAMQSQVFNVYNSSMYTNLASFNVKYWSQDVFNVNTNNFKGEYTFQITLSSGEIITCDKPELSLTTESIVEEEPTKHPDLPLLTCGETLNDIPDSNDGLETASIGEIFYIQSFPILLTSVDGSSGYFTGTGIIPVPFEHCPFQTLIEMGTRICLW